MGQADDARNVTDRGSDAVLDDKQLDQHNIFTTDFGFLPIPKHLRYNPDEPFHFGLLLNICFGFGSTFTVANLYYCQPLLIQFSQSFNVSYSQVSRIPTLIQAGYAAGILLISPLGDLVRRRQLILALVAATASLTIGLALTTNFIVFQVLTFLIGALTVTPQILLPLAADLAPPARRASAIAVVLSGLMLGVLLARVLAGAVAQAAQWRVVYYMAIAVQYVVLAGAWRVLPDYPPKNAQMTYAQILWTMARYAVTEPLLIQTCLVNLASSACFSNFWVTLTFLLGGPPYHYSTLVIGLFGLIGMFGVAMGPLVGRVIDRLVPWYATLVSMLALMCFQAIMLGAAGIHVAAVVVACLGLDLFRQAQQVSLSTAIFGISAAARSRINAVFILSLFIGQVMGTSVGAQVFLQHGWRANAALAMAWYAYQLAVLLLRGPHVRRGTWVGYEGGWEARKGVVERRKREEREREEREEREGREREEGEREEREREREKGGEGGGGETRQEDTPVESRTGSLIEKEKTITSEEPKA